jgi:hypothetical protein
MTVIPGKSEVKSGYVMRALSFRPHVRTLTEHKRWVIGFQRQRGIECLDRLYIDKRALAVLASKKFPGTDKT